MAVRVLIEGVVQGVGFRAWLEGQARLNGVRGWVRNLDDGRVEAWFEGDAEAIDDLVQAAHEGPRFAQVDRIDRSEATDQQLIGFEIRQTGPADA